VAGGKSESVQDLMAQYNEEYFLKGSTSGLQKPYSEKWLSGCHRDLHRWIHKFYPGKRRILVLGCALGLQVKTSLRCGCEAWGVDWTPLLSKHKLTSNLVRATVWALPFKDRAFNLGVNVNLMEHIPEDLTGQVLREQFRVCENQFFVIPPGSQKYMNVDKTHVHFKPLSYWIRTLEAFGRVQHTLKVKPPPWHIYIVRDR